MKTWNIILRYLMSSWQSILIMSSSLLNIYYTWISIFIDPYPMYIVNIKASISYDCTNKARMLGGRVFCCALLAKLQSQLLESFWPMLMDSSHHVYSFSLMDRSSTIGILCCNSYSFKFIFILFLKKKEIMMGKIGN